MPIFGPLFMDGYLPYKYSTSSSFLYNVTICVDNSNSYMLTGIQLAWKKISTGNIILGFPNGPMTGNCTSQIYTQDDCIL